MISPSKCNITLYNSILFSENWDEWEGRADYDDRKYRTAIFGQVTHGNHIGYCRNK